MSARSRHLPWAAAVCLSAAVAAGADETRPANVPPARHSASAVVVCVQPVASVAERDVRVADVASIEGGDFTLRQRIGDLDLADPPRPDQGLRISREQIHYRLRIAGIETRLVSVEGAEAVRVSLSRYDVPEQEIVDTAREFLLSRLPGKPEDITIQLARPIRGPVRVPGSKENVGLEAFLRSPQTPLGKVRVDVAVSANGRRQLVVPVDLEVHLYQRIAVSARRIERGQSITEEMIHFDRRPVENLADYLTAADNPVGQRAKRHLSPLQAIVRADLERAAADEPVVVKQREVVRLVARAGSLRVTATGEALQDGRVGQMIRVRNVDSKIIVLGRVLDRSRIEVLR